MIKIRKAKIMISCASKNTGKMTSMKAVTMKTKPKKNQTSSSKQ